LNVKPVPKTQFSPRELEVITLISQGLTNEEIGEKLLLSTRSVESYRSNLIKKSMVRNTAELVSSVFLNGIVKK
jgi:DNA-binding NarL/FixJ family response regulator